MKTLSVQQPWASMICSGIKDVENRTWKAAEVPGRILIHASSKKITKNFYSGISEEMESYIKNDVFFGNLPALATLPTSAIIGYVTVKGFDDGKVDSVWAAEEGVYKWKLEDAWMFDERILNVNGKLNLFEYDLDENNLPSAHQVDIRDITTNYDEEDEDKKEEDEIFVPCNKEIFEQIKSGDLNPVEIFLTHYMHDILCVESEFKMKPFKYVTFEYDDKYVRFELEEGTGIFDFPDIHDETKPYMIYTSSGEQISWMEAVFELGKKIDEGELVSFCGGNVISTAE